jgi:hypothetical protein
MINLYFNTKISKESSNRNSGDYFYPVTYPNNTSKEDPLDILLLTIKSYSPLDFEHAFFNIHLEGAYLEQENLIREVIKASLKAKNLHINFTRPSTLSDWKTSVEDLIKLIGGDDPLLVAMNHDHLFIDYTPLPFIEAVSTIFKKESFKKVFYYSHAPELLSWTLNGKDRGVYTNIGNYLYKSSEIDGWLDSFCVMTPKTLLHIFNCALSNSSYMGRIDWPGVRYRKLDLYAYIFPREFFKHYDGYGHITGIRLISGIHDLQETRPGNLSQIEQRNFYYQKWLDVSLIALKDRLAVIKHSALKITYINSIDELFKIFKFCYLDKDRDLGIISSDEYEALVDSVYERIYFNANDVLMQIELDNRLQKRLEQFGLASLLPLSLKRFIKNLIGK